MKFIFKIALVLVVFASFGLGVSPVEAQVLGSEDPGSGNFQLVPCDGTPESPCDFTAFVRGVSRLINFFVFLAVPLATIMFAFAGFKYIFAAGDTGEIEKAHDIFKKVLIGIIIVLVAWLVVNTIVNSLVDTSRFKTGLD